MDTRALKWSGQLGNEFLPKSKYMFSEFHVDSAKNCLYGRTYSFCDVFYYSHMLPSSSCIVCNSSDARTATMGKSPHTVASFSNCSWGHIVLNSSHFQDTKVRHSSDAIVHVLKKCRVLLKDMDYIEKISKPKLMENVARITMKPFSQSSTPWQVKTVCVTLNCNALQESCKITLTLEHIAQYYVLKSMTLD